MCISVDLPEPEGPMTVVSLPRSTPSVDPAQRIDCCLALAVAACDCVRLDDGAVRPVRALHTFSVPVRCASVSP